MNDGYERQEDKDYLVRYGKLRSAGLDSQGAGFLANFGYQRPKKRPNKRCERCTHHDSGKCCHPEPDCVKGIVDSFDRNYDL